MYIAYFPIDFDCIYSLVKRVNTRLHEYAINIIFCYSEDYPNWISTFRVYFIVLERFWLYVHFIVSRWALVQWFQTWMFWMTLIPSNTLIAFSVLKLLFTFNTICSMYVFPQIFFTLIRPTRLLTNFALFVRIYD